MKKIVLVFAVCVISVLAQDNFENAGVRVALKIYDDCSKADGFSSCLKEKAITFLDRLGRMEKFHLTEGITIIRVPDVQTEESAVTEEQLEKILPRASVAKDDALNSMLFDKIVKFISSRTLEITMPKFTAEDFGVEQGRKGGEGGGGGGGGGGGKKGGMKGMMGGMMMGIAAKMAAMIPVAIAGLFLLAGKALITAKIALLLSGIIAIKKLFGSKHGGGGGGGAGGGDHGHGWQSSSGHGGGGWQSGGGGWDKRSIDYAQQMAYKAYSPK